MNETIIDIEATKEDVQEVVKQLEIIAFASVKLKELGIICKITFEGIENIVKYPLVKCVGIEGFGKNLFYRKDLIEKSEQG